MIPRLINSSVTATEVIAGSIVYQSPSIKKVHNTSAILIRFCVVVS